MTKLNISMQSPALPFLVRDGAGDWTTEAETLPARAEVLDNRIACPVA